MDENDADADADEGQGEEYHPDAHPEAIETEGRRDYGEWGQCIATSRTRDARCRQCALGPHGKCYNHGGATPTADENERVGRGDQTGNTNAVKHGLHTELNSYYNKVMNDRERALCDDIYEDYVDRYEEINGDAIQGDLARMFEIAVNHIKVIHSDNWAVEKPAELRSGSPMVDKETKQSEGGQYNEYKQTVVLKGQLALRREDRSWLKDHNMMNDPTSQAAESTGTLAEAIKEVSNSS